MAKIIKTHGNKAYAINLKFVPVGECVCNTKLTYVNLNKIKTDILEKLLKLL